MRTRPAIGTRVRIIPTDDLSRVVHRKTGTVVFHPSVDSYSIVVRLDPQEPLRPYMDKMARRFDLKFGRFKAFRRRQGDWIMDYQNVQLLKSVRTPKSPKRTPRRRGSGVSPESGTKAGGE